MKLKSNTGVALIFMSMIMWSCTGSGGGTEEEVKLTLTGPTEVTVPEKGLKQVYGIETDGSWEVVRKSADPWAEARPTKGENDGTFTISFSENGTGKERKVEFVILANGRQTSHKISATQGGTLKIWEEKGIDKYENMPGYALGIDAYAASNMVYRRDGVSVMDFEISDPNIVSVATEPMGWGYFQFPNIYSAVGGQIVVTWSLAEDSAASYGKGGSDYRVTSDNGKTWSRPATRPIGGGLTISGGKRLSISTPAALVTADIEGLPEPLISGVKEAYGRTFSFYLHDDLPEALKGVYMAKWDANNVYTAVRSVLNDPGFVRYTDNDLFPVVWWGDMRLMQDNSIVVGIYPAFYYNEAARSVAPSGVSFYRTTDEAASWNIIGKIPYTYDSKADPNGFKRAALGYTEPDFAVTQDGSFVCVIRTTDGYGDSPMYIAHSADQGVNWTTPKPFTLTGVLPKLLQLKNGVLVLASGRPGLQLRFSFDGKGETWTDPFEMLPFDVKNPSDHVSCGYPRLLETGNDSFMVVYSDFKYRTESGDTRKAIVVREVKVNKRNE